MNSVKFEKLNQTLGEINSVMGDMVAIQHEMLIASLESLTCCPVTLTDSPYFPREYCFRYRKGKIVFHTEHGDFSREIKYDAFDMDASGKLIELAFWFSKCQL